MVAAEGLGGAVLPFAFPGSSLESQNELKASGQPHGYSIKLNVESGGSSTLLSASTRLKKTMRRLPHALASS